MNSNETSLAASSGDEARTAADLQAGEFPTTEFSTSMETTLQSSWTIPVWFWILFAASALSFAIWVYWSERGTSGRFLRGILATLRFLLLLAVLWMLCGWNWQQYKTERPELAVVIDRSASMAARDISTSAVSADASSSRFGAVRTFFENISPYLRETLRDSYQIRSYAVAETLESIPSVLEQNAFQQVAPTGMQSKLGENLSRIIERHSGRGAAAIVFFSDGINTAGPSLAEAEKMARLAAIPVYSIMVGRELTVPDVRLADLLMDRDVFFGDRVSAEVAVFASGVQDAQITVTLRDASTRQKLDETQIDLSADKSQGIANLSFVPDRAGQIPLEIEASALAGESDLTNNSLSQSVDVQDKTLRVLFVQQQPSYEFRFLKHLLERSQEAGQRKASSFEIFSVLQESDPDYVDQDMSALRLVPSDAEQLSRVDVFIFGPLNPELISRRSQQLIYEAVTEAGAGCVFIYGSGSPAEELSGWPLEKLLPVSAPLGSSQANQWSSPRQWQPSSIGISSLPMQIAASPEQSLALWSRLPGFHSMCELGEIKIGAQILAVAVGENANRSAKPLLITQYAGAGRVALQATDETYRWTSFGGSDTYHQRYWGQLLRWLSRGKLNPADEKSTLLVEPRQAKIGQTIRVETQIGLEVPEESLPESAVVTLSSDQQNRTTLSLSRTPRSNRTYQATASNLTPGTYRALLVQPATEDPPSQEFTITAPPGEQTTLRADAEAMQSLAERSRGRFYTLNEAELALENLPAGKATRLGTLPPQPLWNSWWVALLFVSLITVEWIIRRHARML